MRSGVDTWSTVGEVKRSCGAMVVHSTAEGGGPTLRLVFLAALAMGWLAGAASAATLAAGDAAAIPDATDTLVPLTLSLAAADRVSAIQVDLAFNPAALSVARIETGAAAAEAGKTVSSYDLGGGKHRLIIIGMNKDLIGDGVVAEAYFDIADDARNGAYSVALQNHVLSDPVGLEVPAETQPGSVTVSGGLDPEGEDTCCRPGCLGAGAHAGPNSRTGGLFAGGLLATALVAAFAVQRTRHSKGRNRRGAARMRLPRTFRG